MCRTGNQIAATEASIISKIDYANRIFSQIGVCFDLLSISNNVGSSSDWAVREYDMVTNVFGETEPILSSQAQNLMNTYTRHDCIELYFVGRFSNGGAAAFSTRFGIIISQRASEHVVAHELGHRLGLRDCYAYTLKLENGVSTRIWIENADIPVNGEVMSKPRDWGDEQGRGFYEKTDSGKSILYQLLMYGVDGENSLDIPSHDVLSLIQGAFAPTLTFHSHVGVDFIIPDNSEVFTQ